jgi:hypothetical protein
MAILVMLIWRREIGIKILEAFVGLPGVAILILAVQHRRFSPGANKDKQARHHPSQHQDAKAIVHIGECLHRACSKHGIYLTDEVDNVIPDGGPMETSVANVGGRQTEMCPMYKWKAYGTILDQNPSSKKHLDFTILLGFCEIDFSLGQSASFEVDSLFDFKHHGGHLCPISVIQVGQKRTRWS